MSAELSKYALEPDIRNQYYTAFAVCCSTSCEEEFGYAEASLISAPGAIGIYFETTWFEQTDIWRALDNLRRLKKGLNLGEVIKHLYRKLAQTMFFFNQPKIFSDGWLVLLVSRSYLLAIVAILSPSVERDYYSSTGSPLTLSHLNSLLLFTNVPSFFPCNFLLSHWICDLFDSVSLLSQKNPLPYFCFYRLFSKKNFASTFSELGFFLCLIFHDFEASIYITYDELGI